MRRGLRVRENICEVNMSGISISNVTPTDGIDLTDEEIDSLQSQIELTRNAGERGKHR